MLGANGDGQVGDGTLSFGQPTPVPVSGLTSGVTAIDGGGYHTCAIVNGGAQCWGDNLDAQIGDGTRGDRRLTPVGVSGLTSGVTDISAGGHHTCALVGDGAKCWGANFAHQLGDGTSVSWRLVTITVKDLGTGVTALSSDGWHGCALTRKRLEFPAGSSIMRVNPVWCWGAVPLGEGPVDGIFAQ
jgi:trimeric autotransporter adhesin